MKKTIIILFCILACHTLVNAQILKNTLGKLDRLEIGNFNTNYTSQPSIRFNQGQLNKIIDAVLLNGTQIHSAQLDFDVNSNSWYLVGHGQQLNSYVNVKIDLTREGNSLYLVSAGAGCSYTCTGSGRCSCDITLNKKCELPSCNCNGQDENTCKAGVSSITIGPILVELIQSYKINNSNNN